MKFCAGFVIGWVVLLLGGYIFIWSGGVPVATSAPPLPLEKFLVKTAMHAAFRNADSLKSPVEESEANILAGAKLYKKDCAFCHGLPEQEKVEASVVFFPPPPQLYHHSVSDDPIGEIFLKVKDGIRLSAMPSFAKVYSEEQMWQVSLLLHRGTEIPAAVKAELLRQ